MIYQLGDVGAPVPATPIPAVPSCQDEDIAYICDDKEPWRREGLNASPCASPSKTIGVYKYLIAESVAMEKDGVAWE